MLEDWTHYDEISHGNLKEGQLHWQAPTFFLQLTSAVQHQQAILASLGLADHAAGGSHPERAASQIFRLLVLLLVQLLPAAASALAVMMDQS